MSRPFANESVFRAIADPTRRRILDLLRQSDLTVVEIQQQFRLHRATISQHLAILRTASLISQRRRGRWRVYFLQPHALRTAALWLREYESFWAAGRPIAPRRERTVPH